MKLYNRNVFVISLFLGALGATFLPIYKAESPGLAILLVVTAGFSALVYETLWVLASMVIRVIDLTGNRQKLEEVFDSEDKIE